jgi:hypothetical protein
MNIEPLVMVCWGALSLVYAVLVLIELRHAVLDFYFARNGDSDSKLIAVMQVRTVMVRSVAATFNLVFLFFVASGFIFSAPAFVYVTIIQLALLCLDVGTSLFDRYRLLKTPCH